MQTAISSRRLRTISLSFGVRRKFLSFNGGMGAASSESGFPNTSGLLFAYQNAVRVSASLFRVNGDKILRALFPMRKHKRVHKVFRLPDGQRTRLRERNDELRRQPRFALPCSFAFVAAVYLRIKPPFFDGFFKIGGLYFFAAFVDYARVLADAVRFFSDITQTRNNGAACITSACDFDERLTAPRTTSDFPIADVNASDVFVKKVMRAFSHSIPASLP